MRPNGGPTFSPDAGRRGRIISTLSEVLQQVPFINTVQLTPTRTGLDYEICGDVLCDIFCSGETGADDATIYINWWTSREEPDEFKFHYTESTGFDCGYHRHLNDHVDGDDHFQWRYDQDAEYEYEEIKFDYDRPPGVLWEIINERLPERRHELLSDS